MTDSPSVCIMEQHIKEICPRLVRADNRQRTNLPGYAPSAQREYEGGRNGLFQLICRTDGPGNGVCGTSVHHSAGFADELGVHAHCRRSDAAQGCGSRRPGGCGGRKPRHDRGCGCCHRRGPGDRRFRHPYRIHEESTESTSTAPCSRWRSRK